MSDYTRVQDLLDAGTPPDVLCATCPWDRLCVTPPSMTSAELNRKVGAAAEKDKAAGNGGLGAVLLAVTLGGNVTSGPQCPVFSLRLRGPDGRQIADAIRTYMRGPTT